ncbi:MAG: D-alanyl-D-alanine carboxypeptidase family protein [Candidatus Paceibacterales bacterium]
MGINFKIFFIVLVLSSFFWWGINFFQENLEKFFYAQISQPFQEITFAKRPAKPKKPKLNLQVKSAFSVKINRVGKERILFKKNSAQILPIASLTKLMTALIVLEDPENYNFSEIITISKEAAAQENVPEYGNLKPGERISIEKLLDLTLIYSSNDAALALAEVIGIENFVERMNQKAKILGLESTHFINPTGLDPENLSYKEEAKDYFNHSTAQDLVKLAQHILKNQPLIFEISLKKEPYLIENGLSDLSLPEGQKIIGGKTGYTYEAGGCMLLVSEDEKENYFFQVILGTISPLTRVKEMQKLINNI